MKTSEKEKRSIAVVGAGISGIIAAYYLQREYNVTLFEAESRLGGHTNTFTIGSGVDEGLRVDTGFIVLNNKNYPGLHSFFREIGVGVRWSDMSFGYSCDKSGFEYAGTGFNGLFASRRNLVSPKFFRFLRDIKRFSDGSLRLLRQGALSNLNLGELLMELGLSQDFQEHYLIPMAAAIWSSPDEDLSEFPAELFVSFFNNHGLMGLSDRPKWQTVRGGSSTYVEMFEQQFEGLIIKASPVVSVKRESTENTQEGIVLRTKDKTYKFDRLVMALHADQSRKILEEPSPDEKALLESFR